MKQPIAGRSSWTLRKYTSAQAVVDSAPIRDGDSGRVEALRERVRSQVAQAGLGDGQTDAPVVLVRREARRPRLRRQRLVDLDQVARRDRPALRAQQLVGLPEDARGARSACEVAVQRFVGKALDEVARVVAQHRHALAERVVGRDHHGADFAGPYGLSRVRVDDLDQSHVEIVVQVPLGAGAAADRQHFRHGEGVVDRRAERLGRGGCERCAEQFASAVNSPKPERARTEAALPRRPNKLCEVARVGRQQCRCRVAAAAQSVEAFLRGHEAQDDATRAD